MSGDEIYWGLQGWGEANSGIKFKIKNNPGASKGAQIVIGTDVNNVHPRAYVHWHKMHNLPANFRAQGPKKVYMNI